jgi:hypothetical protein
MRINEVEADDTADKLLALARFAVGRAQDTSAKMQMPVQAFINRAQSMGVDITPDTLQLPLVQIRPYMRNGHELLIQPVRQMSVKVEFNQRLLHQQKRVMDVLQ